MSRHCPECSPWIAPDAVQMLHAVAAAVSLRADGTYLFVVNADGSLVGARELITDLRPPEVGSMFRDDPINKVLRSIVGLSRDDIRTTIPTRTAHMLRCHLRRNVEQIDDADWSHALSMSNQLIGLFTGDLFSLTPNGWRGCHDYGGDATPTLDDLMRPDLRVVAET